MLTQSHSQSLTGKPTICLLWLALKFIFGATLKKIVDSVSEVCLTSYETPNLNLSFDQLGCQNIKHFHVSAHVAGVLRRLNQ